MNNKKYNLLAIGSCRIGTCLNNYQNTYNTWGAVGKIHLNPKCIIGKSWSINEQLELLKLIKGDKPFVNMLAVCIQILKILKITYFF